MKKFFFKQISVLNLVILVVSGITTIVYANRPSLKKGSFAANGKLQATATPRIANQVTCKMISSGAATCFDTITNGSVCERGSNTTMLGFISSMTLEVNCSINNQCTTIGDVS
ncbi:hypothetical protein Cpin_0979 [Chitinophaga pinensis DSM 2588]|uniref:Uncharacterized protein n=1 Tax=Chitinophaga pinensis (strain ATCC 43595 / DSM 2588 / LMG 13176 / NBRC 15968 / NCIMB 11800 / UQM 2034) TaxID=485918 RepID=A0A979GMH8_CHIPD|nr:hypothetical protein Cpin_0979 [Chitinophaga pinensis DSM 2588]